MEWDVVGDDRQGHSRLFYDSRRRRAEWTRGHVSWPPAACPREPQADTASCEPATQSSSAPSPIPRPLHRLPPLSPLWQAAAACLRAVAVGILAGEPARAMSS